MRYALLVCVDESGELSEADAERQYGEFMAFQDEMEARGVLVARERLRPTALATTVRVRERGPGGGGRAVRRDQGADRRVLHHRVCRSGRGDRDRLAQSRRQARDDRGQAGVGDLAAAQAAVADAFRSDWGRVVAYLIRVTGNWDLAEECAQDAFERALERWPRDGIPSSPAAWLKTTARNRALDRLRRSAVGEAKLKELTMLRHQRRRRRWR